MMTTLSFFVSHHSRFTFTVVYDAFETTWGFSQPDALHKGAADDSTSNVCFVSTEGVILVRKIPKTQRVIGVYFSTLLPG